MYKGTDFLFPFKATDWLLSAERSVWLPNFVSQLFKIIRLHQMAVCFSLSGRPNHSVNKQNSARSDCSESSSPS